MKEAMWGVGIIMLAIFGIFLISLFGNITVTNQQDYTVLKNTVEASVYDSIDLASYRAGFCICTDRQKNEKGVYVFESSNEYEIIKENIVDGVCPTSNKASCEYIEGEYILDKKVFAESFVRRFSESVKSNSDYQILIQDVIEYPPKVSIIVNSKNSNEVDNSNYTINNKIDAILEMDSKVRFVETPSDEYACYVNGDNDIEYVIKGQNKTGWSISNISQANCRKYRVVTHHYIINSTIQVHEDDMEEYRYGGSYTTRSYSSSDLIDSYKDMYEMTQEPTNPPASGMVNGDIEVIYYYNQIYSQIGSGGSTISESSSCKWHSNRVTKITCKPKKNSGYTRDINVSVNISSKTGKSSCQDALNSCIDAANIKCPNGYEYKSGCGGYQTYRIIYRGGTNATYKDKTCSTQNTKICSSRTMTECICQG